MFVFLSFVLSLSLTAVEVMGGTVIMTDTEDYSFNIYECFESKTWQKFCEYRDFTLGACRPWRLDACEPAFVQHGLSPCPLYECEVR